LRTHRRDYRDTPEGKQQHADEERNRRRRARQPKIVGDHFGQAGSNAAKVDAMKTSPSICVVRSWGANTQRYLELLSSGTRSLRHELRELRCLGTVYGPQQVEEVIGELLADGVVGASRVERALRLREAEPKAPPPMELADERLQFATTTPQLDSYDALLLQARAEKESEDEQGDDLDDDLDDDDQEKTP
jgi:hypothetical protein